MAQLGSRPSTRSVGQSAPLDTSRPPALEGPQARLRARCCTAGIGVHEPGLLLQLAPGSRAGQGAGSAADRAVPRSDRRRFSVRFTTTIANVNRTVGTMLGHEVTKAHGGKGLPNGTIDITFDGSAGNSFGAFLPCRITLRVYGDANDYVGKGLSGGCIVVRPSDNAPVGYVAEDNIIGGNVILFGATSGRVFLGGGRRKIRRPQLGRRSGGRGRGRPRVRIHDRRQSGDPGRHRT